MFVYVAGPYSAPDPIVNTRRAIDAAMALLAAGHRPFVPHLSAFLHLVYPSDYELWLDYDLAWISRCDALLRLPGESPGADREVQEAIRLGLHVHLGSIETFPYDHDDESGVA